MQINPLDQFRIHKVININLLGVDISLTNSAVLMVVASIAATVYLLLTIRNKQLIPSRLQMSGELLHQTINDMVSQTIGTSGRKFVPMIFTLFLFILLCNLFGMLPYGFTVTSHISVTIILAAIIFFTITIVGFYLHGIKFLSLFLPSGTPGWMAPLMIVIELFAFLAKPLSLSLRLTANMVAGHILLKVITGFILSLTLVWKFLPFPIIIILIGFEIFIAILQAYIFALLSCAYLSDAVNLPH